jgi:hypothetical protein
MKKFLLYILLPGVVLGSVYNAGHNSGVRSAAEPQVQESVQVTADSQRVQPRPVKKAVAPRPAPVVEPVDDWSIPAGTRVAPKIAKPMVDPNTPLRIPKQDVQLDWDAAVPRVIETEDGVMSAMEVPVVRQPVLAPAPTRSVYDRRPEGSSMSLPIKLSELGAVPLAPLQPLEPASVYPQPQPVRTTFKEPVLPSVQSMPSTRIVSPIRITSSAECDCGKQH